MAVNPLIIATNPFSTRYIAPGQLSWIGQNGVSSIDLVKQFDKLGRKAEIVGPHGSGKSTLLHDLIPHLGVVVEYCDQANRNSSQARGQGWDVRPGRAESSDSEIFWFQLRRGSSVMAYFWHRVTQVPKGALLVLDGLEQMGWSERMRLRWLAGRRHLDLLVTAHRGMGLARLVCTEGTAVTLSLLVKQLICQLDDGDFILDRLSSIDLAAMVQRHQGNIRECMMELYDVVEALRREQSN
jgi:hypothetical protein